MDEGRAAVVLPSHDLLARIRNPGATMDLVIPFVMECNASDETVARNIATNSRNVATWLGTSEVHEGVALLCGSGPSLIDDIETIKAMAANGAAVVALNGAAKVLLHSGIMPDIQFIVDARAETASLIGPAHHHLFASQVDPSLFEQIPGAMLVQVGYGPMPELPEHDSEYAIVIGHSSIGNIALGLAYTMGYRTMHCFGYDSSHRGEASHAAHQAINDGDPCVVVQRNGREYVASFTMHQQAMIFPRVAHTLGTLGCHIEVHGSGLLPDTWRADLEKPLEQREREKYRAMWQHNDYRTNAPGLDHVGNAIERLAMKNGDTLVDFGCGAGRSVKAFNEQGVVAVGVDIANNAVEADISYVEACLWDLPPTLRADWGFCTDVMEHIPPGKVNDVLASISRAVTRGAYLLIDSAPDVMGALIGQPLHLTVQPPEWWHARLSEHFGSVTELDGGVFICRKES